MMLNIPPVITSVSQEPPSVALIASLPYYCPCCLKRIPTPSATRLLYTDADVSPQFANAGYTVALLLCPTCSLVLDALVTLSDSAELAAA